MSYPKNHCQHLCQKAFFLSFLLEILWCPALHLIISFMLSLFLWCDRCLASFYYTWISDFLSTVYWKSSFSPLSSLCSLVKYQLPIYVWVYFWDPNSLPLSMCLFLCQYNTVLITIAFVVVFEIRKCDAFFCIPRIALAIQSNGSIQILGFLFSVFVKNVIGILIVIAFNL